LSGSIPTQLGSLMNLRELYLSGNKLTGNIPASLGSLTNLYKLTLSGNHLTGDIPTSFGSLTNLQYLYLSSNQLTGSIPATLTNLTSLVDGYSDFRWNALYTTDNALRTFLNSKQAGGNWEGTQTIAPTNLAATALSSTSVQLTWTPIVYTGDTGGYEVYYSTTSGGAYTYYPTTGTKSDATATVDGLTPGTQYFFKVRTVTNPHGNNQNTVYSEYTSEGTVEQQLLTVIKSGDGTIRSQVAGIDCGSDCRSNRNLSLRPGSGPFHYLI